VNKVDRLRDKTIADFGNQWMKWTDIKGYYGSLELFKDITSPLIDMESLIGKLVVDIGSGTGRTVSMLLDAGVKHVYAIEPSRDAFQVLEKNIKQMKRKRDVTAINTRGDCWSLNGQVDYVFSIGVIHHIPGPAPVLQAAHRALKPGGYLFVWLYGYEGNEFYIAFVEPLRRITTRLPHMLLRGLVELLYCFLWIYRNIGRVTPLPLRDYIEKVLWLDSPQKRRLVIYDQLNPAFAKYYRREEAVGLLENSGFRNVRIHHRHGYSWSVIGQKPVAQECAPADD